MLKTRAQTNSQAIHQQFLTIKSMADKPKTRYGALCHQVPIMILQNGLMQAMGFLKGKGEDDPEKPETILLTHIAKQLTGKSADDFLQKLHQCNVTDYQFLTRQALESAIWYKRYAESILKVQSGDDEP